MQNIIFNRVLRTGAFLLLVTLIIPWHATGHGVGQEFTQESGPYTIDIGASVFTFRTDENVQLNFVLLETESEKVVRYDSVWVQIKNSEERVIYASTLAPSEETGEGLMVYQFPDVDNYTLAVRYRIGEETVDAEFSIPVEGDEKTGGKAYSLLWLVFVAAGGALAGSLLSAALSKRRQVRE